MGGGSSLDIPQHDDPDFPLPSRADFERKSSLHNGSSSPARDNFEVVPQEESPLKGRRGLDGTSQTVCLVCLTDVAELYPFGTGCAHRFCKDCIAGFDKHKTTACPLCRAARHASPTLLYASPREVQNPMDTHRPGWLVSLTSLTSPRHSRLREHGRRQSSRRTLLPDGLEEEDCIPHTPWGWVWCFVWFVLFYLFVIAAANAFGQHLGIAHRGSHTPIVHPQFPNREYEKKHLPGEEGGTDGLHKSPRYHHAPLPGEAPHRPRPRPRPHVFERPHFRHPIER